MSDEHCGFENENQDNPRRRPRKKAREKVMDLLARREHSELELRRKLAVYYELSEVDDAIEFAKQNKWMKRPEELAEKVAEQLGRRNRGANYIKKFLASRGLPQVAQNADEDFRKASELVKAKLGHEAPFEIEEQTKIARLLQNRGFDDETIRKVIHEKP